MANPFCAFTTADRISGGGVRLRIFGDVLRLSHYKWPSCRVWYPSRQDVAMVMLLIGFRWPSLHEAIMQIPAKVTAFFLATQMTIRLFAARQHSSVAAGYLMDLAPMLRSVADLQAGHRPSSASIRCISG